MTKDRGGFGFQKLKNESRGHVYRAEKRLNFLRCGIAGKNFAAEKSVYITNCQVPGVRGLEVESSSYIKTKWKRVEDIFNPRIHDICRWSRD